MRRLLARNPRAPFPGKQGGRRVQPNRPAVQGGQHPSGPERSGGCGAKRSIAGRRGGPRRESRPPCAPGKANKKLSREARYLIYLAPGIDARRAETAFFSGLGLREPSRAANGGAGRPISDHGDSFSRESGANRQTKIL